MGDIIEGGGEKEDGGEGGLEGDDSTTASGTVCKSNKIHVLY